VFRDAIAEPGRFVSRTIAKGVALLHHYEAGDHYHVGFVSRFVPYFQLPFLAIWTVLPLGIAGLVLGFALRCRPALELACFAVLYGLTLVAFFTNTRYRLPLLMPLIPLAVWSAGQIAGLLREQRRKDVAIWGAAAVAAFTLAFAPLPGAGDLTAYYNTHALLLDANGDEAGAVSFWEQSEALEGAYSSFASLSLAGVRIKQGRAAPALSHLSRISDDSPVAAERYAIEGEIYRRLGQTDRAIVSLERSLDINSAQRRVRRRLILVLKDVDPARQRQHERELAHVDQFYQGDADAAGHPGAG
jgi:tetratricopeptide (TPR) repeat protein